jgi:hypothetical protein
MSTVTREAPVSISIKSLEAVILQLQSVMRSKPSSIIQKATLNAVAEVIGGVRFGSTEQRRLMDYASGLGFEPWYYASSVRVRWDCE